MIAILDRVQSPGFSPAETSGQNIQGFMVKKTRGLSDIYTDVSVLNKVIPQRTCSKHRVWAGLVLLRRGGGGREGGTAQTRI